MLEFSVSHEYKEKLEQLLPTLTPEQKALFEELSELLSSAVLSMAMENKIAGYKEGVIAATELLQKEDE